MGWLLAALSGALAGFSYPTVFAGRVLPDMGWLGLFAWVPLFFGLAKASPRRAFLLSAFSGIFHYGISMYWLYTALHGFGHLSPALSVIVLALLVLILAAYFGAIFYFSRWAAPRAGIPESVLRPLVWVAAEYLRGHVPMGGFPWSQIAYSQGSFSSLLQFADLFGVYGVTFLLVLLNEGIVQVCGKIWGRRAEGPEFSAERGGRGSNAYIFMVAVLWLGALSYGYARLRQTPPAPDPQLKVGIVQGNIAQDKKWDRRFVQEIINIYGEGSLKLQERGAKLILWPEAAYPLSLLNDQPSLSLYSPDLEADLLFGAVTHSRREGMRLMRRVYYNSALLIDAQSNLLGVYHKRHLVPFGEYVPWKDLLFFAKKLTAEVGDIVPGASYHPLEYRGSRLGVLICYEDIFPEIARTMVAGGAAALVNLTNDAWYGHSSAAYQHQVFSQFRAVETRRALVRATNTGLSSLIDRQGRVLWQGKLFEREDFLADLPFYHDRSLYVRIGDAFPIVCLSLGGVALLLALFKRKVPCPKN